jgi:integrase
MKDRARKSCERAYGYFLDHCRHTGVLDQGAGAGAHVTRERVDSFLHELTARVNSVTRWSYVSKMRRVAEILSRQDFGWLKEIEAELRHQAIPRPKHHKTVDSRRLLAVGLDLVARGENSVELTRHRRSRLIRDGLMILLLSFVPIRLGNLHSLRIGRQLRRIDGTWWILLEGNETKSGRPDERPLPDVLTLIIDRWVEVWRKTFRDPQDFLWPSTKGGALAYTYVGATITKRTRQELGVAINPHLFRDCAVYTVANLAGDRMGIASGLLQHTDPRVTEKHYNKGASFTAVRRYQVMVLQLRV